MADVHAHLDEITALVEGSRSMPMSASIMVNKAELLERLQQLREMLPTAIAQATSVISDRDEVVEEGKREAERLLAEARKERSRLIARTEIATAARVEAEQMVEEARATAEAMRLEVEDYVDAKLANFEVVLQKTIAAVERGREKLRGRSDLASLGAPADDPLPT